MNRLLITGAAGGLGRVLRGRLSHMAKVIRVSDIADLGTAAAHEEIMPCALEDETGMRDLVAGCDGVIHLGGVSVERGFDLIEKANLRGVYNLYEAARATGCPRILFASSNHAIGYYPQDVRLTPRDPIRPDGLYGVSKVFGEAIASLYHSKFGQETALVRIGTCAERPKDWRQLSTWLSHDDFVSLIEAVFRAPRLGCPVFWGVSANDASWWDNSAIGFLGWRPRDNAADHAERVRREVPAPDTQSAAARYQGGIFIDEPIHKD